MLERIHPRTWPLFRTKPATTLFLSGQERSATVLGRVRCSQYRDSADHAAADLGSGAISLVPSAFSRRRVSWNSLSVDRWPTLTNAIPKARN